MTLFYRNYTKKAFLSVLFIFIFCISFSKTYYVSNAGDDANSGQSKNAAWKSLIKVNNTVFDPGDSILFKKGDVFIGAFSISNSGTSGSPIVYATYGTGSKPTISGFQTITEWVSVGNGIYSASTTAPVSLNIVSVNGVNTAKGRYPNTGYLSYESHSGLTRITDNSLTSTPNWTGAEVVIRTNSFVSEVRSITSHSGTNISFSAVGLTPNDGFGYFIQNDVKALDLPGEWSISNGTIYMYFGSSIPSDYVVKVGNIDDVLTINTKSFIVIEGLSIQGANKKDIVIWNGSHISIKNCDISFSGGQGIFNSGATDLLVEGNLITNTNATAILSNAENTTIRNNTISNIAMFAGMQTMWQTSGIYCDGSSGLLIENNQISNLGYNGIHFLGNNSILRNNFIDSYCNVLIDGGGIYTDRATYTGREINSNIIINGMCDLSGTTLTKKATVGIYLDEQSEQIKVDGNSVSTIDGFGLLLHSTRNNIISNNTIYNCSDSQICFSHNTSAPNQTNISLTGNVFVAKEATQKVMYQYSTYNDYLFGSADNNVYARPIDDTNTIAIEDYSTWYSSFARHNLDWWKSFSGYDANSKKSPITINSTDMLSFEYNSTTTPKTILLAYPMISANGTKYSENITLQPFTSVVLMKDNAVSSIAIKNRNEANQIDIYPNPSQGEGITVRFAELPVNDSRIEVFDLSGRKLISKLITRTSEELNIDNLVSGTYLVRSVLGSTEFVNKLIVNK